MVLEGGQPNYILPKYCLPNYCSAFLQDGHYNHNAKNKFGLQKNGKNLIISEKLKILPKCYGPHFEH